MAIQSAAKNTITNWLNILVTSILSFIVRDFLIRYLGADILGVDATIIETLNLLSLSELGIQTSISYKMYKPIIDKDTTRQRELFNLFKVAYRIVGIVIFVIGLGLLPLLDSIVNTTIDMRIVYTAYLLQLIVISISYFTSYYRILFLTYQKQYICTQFDIFLGILGLTLQIIILYFTHNYIMYLCYSYIHVFTQYFFIASKARREFPDVVRKIGIKSEDIKELISDLKELIVGSVAGYLYGSTDNILLSVFFGSITTGLVSNYKMITQLMRRIISSANAAVGPTWGDFLYRTDDNKTVEKYYDAFIFFEFCACLVLLAPTVVLCDKFILLWLGEEFIVQRVVMWLIIADIFCSCINEPSCVLIRNLGLFKQEKKVSIIASIVNLVLSYLLAKYIGIAGIFAGTLCAVFVFWVMRSYYVNKTCFAGSMQSYLRFWKNNFVYVFTFIALCVLASHAISKLQISNGIIELFVGGIISELLVVIVLIVFWKRTTSFQLITSKFMYILMRKK